MVVSVITNGKLVAISSNVKKREAQILLLAFIPT